MRIAQAEGKKWKKEVRSYLIAYRLTHHHHRSECSRTSVWKKNPDQVTWIPWRPCSEWSGRQRRRNESKSWEDKKRHTEYSNLVPGDRVLLRQEKQNKLSTPFAPEPYDVVSRIGSSIIIKSPEGVQLKRNTAHFKTYEESPQLPSRTVSLPVKEDVRAESPTYRRILRRMVKVKECCVNLLR